MIDLSRFIEAHKENYFKALSEIKNGRKESHWMWYIFPQVSGLGESFMSKFFAIESLDEAKAFLDNDYLSCNLVEICTALLDLETTNAKKIFGFIDSLKLKSCMTLFDYVSPNDIYGFVLDKFFDGEKCNKTLLIIELGF
ncbi:MAG: DUF1810 domain-containing protein [Clostridia bacterium]|nr:DUF1810 domain-containing protein [Clostridia bacterium]